MTPLLTPEQAAKELGIGVDTLGEMRRHGEIPYVNIGRGKKRETPRYELADLIAWREKRKQTACQSTSGKTRRTGSTSTIFSSKVSDIQAARERLVAARLRQKSSGSATRPDAPGKSGRPSSTPDPT
jgi:excisionase family DNA binding protein